MKTKFFASLLLAFAVLSARAVTISQWTFEVNTPTDVTDSATGPSVADESGNGNGTATAVHASAATDWTTPAGNGSANSLSANTWAQNDYFQFTLSTMGYQSIKVTWDQTRSSTGPATFDFAYDFGGGFVVALNNYTVPAISWSSVTPDGTGTTSFSVDLSAVLGLNNLSSVSFRLIDDSATGATAGTGRIDNFSVTGETFIPAVPDNGTTAILLSIPLLGLWTLRRFAERTA